MPLTVWDVPPPTSEQNIAQRRYKKVVGIIKHNEPIDIPHINIIFSRTYSGRKLRGIVKQAMQNGHIRREKKGFVVTDSVE